MIQQFHSWGYTQRNATQFTPETPHTHVYCSAIQNSQVKETAKMPTTDEWIKQMWYLYTMEFYSAMKNEILLFSNKWMEDSTLSDVSQAQKTKNHMFSLICRL
jgi:hypothetical protein